MERRLNEREITLTESDCQRFTQHVQSRNRNGIPLPFPEELCPAEESGKSPSQEGSRDKKSRNKNASSIKWRCFIRAVTAIGSGRLILTFLPASFKYVRLMCRHGRSRSSSTESSSRGPQHAPEKGPIGAKQESGEIKILKLSSLLTQGSVEGLF